MGPHHHQPAPTYCSNEQKRAAVHVVISGSNDTPCTGAAPTRRDGFEASKHSMLRMIPELGQSGQLDLRRHSAPCVDMATNMYCAASSPTCSLRRKRLSASPSELFAEGMPTRSTNFQAGMLQPGPPPQPQAWLVNRAAVLVIRWWMGNQLPVRCMDLCLGLTIVALYTLCLFLSLIVPATMTLWRNVLPEGIIAQTFSC